MEDLSKTIPYPEHKEIGIILDQTHIVKSNLNREKRNNKTNQGTIYMAKFDKKTLRTSSRPVKSAKKLKYIAKFLTVPA